MLSDSGIWSPDSQKILNSVIAEGQVQSILIDLVTGQIDMLPQPISSGVWSPDSHYIVYHAPTEDSTTHLYGMDIHCFAQSLPCEFKDLTFLKIQTLYDDPVWSPDGHAIVYGQVTGEGLGVEVVVAYLRCVDLDESCVEHYENVGSSPNSQTPLWSADNQRLAFVSDLHDITIIRLSDKSTRTVTVPTVISGLQSWSPDGEYLIFTSDTSFQSGMGTTYLLDVDQGLSRVLFPNQILFESPEWRPRPH